MTKNIDNKSIKQIVKHLIADGYVRNQRDFAEKFGYSEVGFSHIMNGQRTISRPFWDQLYSIYPNINMDWLLTGEGNMFNTTTTGSDNIVQSGIVNGDNHQVNSSCEVSRLVSIIEVKDW